MTIEHWILGSSINHFSSSWVVTDHVLKAYWWLPQHPVTHLAQMRGTPMLRRVKKRNGPGWKHAGHCLFALKVNCYLKIKHWEIDGRDCDTLTWSEAAEVLSQTKCRRELGSQRKAGGVYCFCAANSKAHHVFMSLLPKKFSHHPTIQLEDMIPFPCCHSLYHRIFLCASPSDLYFELQTGLRL